ncbi:MAG TPA: hypothetical protein DCK93_21470 [Blastocatellia bacterium]|jgi:hypothetical protein|nr:hypothetical protein [Blastocatellia bacterium]HAF25443.1 hypothetical protein [Blastocatellia bacterium]
MMNAEHFRRIALQMEGAIEGAHMGHPDFRVNGRIFATLHPDLQRGMVKLTPEQQQRFTRENPEMFVPESGAWGRQGCTRVRLDLVGEDALGETITLAWQNTTRKNVVGQAKPKRKTRSIPPSPKR